jgi:hypothetical protein
MTQRKTVGEVIGEPASSDETPVSFDVTSRPPARDAGGHFLPGHSGNPLGPLKGLPAFKQMQALAREKSMEALIKLLALTDDVDSRVAYMACTHVLERAFGKPREYDPNEDRPPQIDLLKMSPEDREAIRQMLEAAARRQRLAQARQEEGAGGVGGEEPSGSATIESGTGE